jgi:hypothetical protein
MKFETVDAAEGGLFVIHCENDMFSYRCFPVENYAGVTDYFC